MTYRTWREREVREVSEKHCDRECYFFVGDLHRNGEDRAYVSCNDKQQFVKSRTYKNQFRALRLPFALVEGIFWLSKLSPFRMVFEVGAEVLGIIGDDGTGVSGVEFDIGTDSNDTAAFGSLGIIIASDSDDD